MNFRSFAPATLVVSLVATAAAAQEPARTGPYLWTQQEADHVTLAAMGTRRREGDYWTATVITLFDMEDVGPIRAETTVEVDCEQQRRRTRTLYLYGAVDPDAPVGPLANVPALEWSEPGPADGPVMTFVCTGQHDAAQVQSRVSAHVTRWRAGK